MHTSWGELEVSDAHVHFLSHRFFALLGGQLHPPLQPEAVCAQIGCTCPPGSPEELAQAWAAELDRHHVHHSTLIASLPEDIDSVTRALAAAPGRFTGFFMANPMAPGAIETAREAIGNGLRGLALFPAMHRYPVHDDRAMTLIAEAAATPKCAVFVHCGALSVGVRKKLGLPSPFDMRFSNPIDLHSVALKFPHTPFIVPHFGAGYFREALMLADLCENVYLDTSSSNSWNRYQPDHPDLTTIFRRTLAVTGPRRLLFGTDSSFFPRGWHKAIFDQQSEALWQAGIQKHDAELILGGNLRRLFLSTVPEISP
ncbi:MAG: amidohydrolase [Bryobacterales bacterium]|nr:amidohydrolase [Bryobacterales bacterium]